MKTSSLVLMVSLAIFLILSGCSNNTTSHTLTKIVAVSKSNVNDWSITPQFSKGQNGTQMVVLDVSYQGSANPSPTNVIVSFGSAKLQIPTINKGDTFQIGTSTNGNPKQLTLDITWTTLAGNTMTRAGNTVTDGQGYNVTFGHEIFSLE